MSSNSYAKAEHNTYTDEYRKKRIFSLFRKYRIKPKSVRVIIVSTGIPYGSPTAIPNVDCILSRAIVAEYNRTMGKVPNKTSDLSKWKRAGILMLSPNSMDQKDLLELIRWFSLNMTNITFIFMGHVCEPLSNLCKEASDPSNLFIGLIHIKDSDIFNKINKYRQLTNQPAIDWSLI